LNFTHKKGQGESPGLGIVFLIRLPVFLNQWPPLFWLCYSAPLIRWNRPNGLFNRFRPVNLAPLKATE